MALGGEPPHGNHTLEQPPPGGQHGKNQWALPAFPEKEIEKHERIFFFFVQLASRADESN